MKRGPRTWRDPADHFMHWLAFVALLVGGLVPAYLGGMGIIQQSIKVPTSIPWWNWTRRVLFPEFTDQVDGAEAILYGSIWLAMGIAFLIGAVVYRNRYLR